MTEITTFSGAATSAHATDDVELRVSALLKQVGGRVRTARERKGVSRRILSNMSGVSPRYLAQLEAGEGNISIGLLTRVAHALDHKIEWFVGEEDPWTSESLRVAELFANADRTTKEAVLRSLRPMSEDIGKAERVCLIGLRGAGKSTLGRHAAEQIDVPFLELNKEISLYGGMPIDEIMALYGVEGYRNLESNALDRVVENYDRIVLAVAGGIVADPETFKKLLSRFHTIWIKASPQEHMDRVRAQGDERPMAGNEDAMDQLQAILTSREPLYGQADAELDTSGDKMNVSLSKLLRLIEERGFFS
jgi:XRE family aerobic/anaerobic benzoate catabolism transcriptional regulator